jgi:hypothetical protein
VRWIVGIPAGCLAFLLVLMLAASIVSHAFPRTLYTMSAPDRPESFLVESYAFMPFGINGHGRYPGEVKVLDWKGHVLDSERVPNAFSVRLIGWSEYSVQFTYVDDGKIFMGSLNLAP